MSRAATLALLTALAASVAGGWTQGAWAAGALPEDRYGPPQPVIDAASPAAMPATGWLTWSSKQMHPVAVSPATPTSSSPSETLRSVTPVAHAAAPNRIATAALPTSLYSAYRPAYPRPAPAATTAHVPAPVLTRAAPSPAPASDGYRPAHFYSVQREFGLNPDPIPLPKQFFADGAASTDLAAPPPPLDPHPVPGTQAATSSANSPANRARAVELDTADSASN